MTTTTNERQLMVAVLENEVTLMDKTFCILESITK